MQMSILMPVHNAQRYVRQAVESILNQTFRDFEFIIIDDGSTDGSTPILEQYARSDKRIRLISRANHGVAATLNEGLALARCELVARMDADDLALPNRLKEQNDEMSRRPLVALGTQVWYIDGDGCLIRSSALPTTHAEIDRTHLTGTGSLIIHPAACLRRAVVMKLGGYRPEFEGAEDLDLFLRLAETGQIANLAQILLCYRLHLGSFGYARRTQQQAAIAGAVRAACARRGCPEPDGLGPGTEPIDAAKVHETWAWWALTGGYRATARKHAWRALRRAPWRPAAWRVLSCALRGH